MVKVVEVLLVIVLALAIVAFGICVVACGAAAIKIMIDMWRK